MTSSPSLEYLRRRVSTLEDRLLECGTEQLRLVFRIENLDGQLVVRTEERDLAREQLVLAQQEAEALRACVEAQRGIISEQLAQLAHLDELLAERGDYVAELEGLTEPAPAPTPDDGPEVAR